MQSAFTFRHTGERIRAWRTFLQMSQRRVSDISGLSVTTLSSIELGNTQPSVETADSIREALGLTVDRLLSATPRETFDTNDDVAA